MSIAIYNDKGEFLVIHVGAVAPESIMVDEGCALMVLDGGGDDDVVSQFYSFSDMAAAPKPEIPVTVDKRSVPINGLVTITVPTTCPNGFPIGVNVEVEGEEFTVDDGEIQIPFADPGTYEITVSGRNYLPVTLTVEVADAG